MPKVLNLINKKFGRLTVISRVANKSIGNSQFSQWKCICDCGKEHITMGTSLSKGETKSCGCYKIDKARKKQGHAGLNDLYNEYKKRAKKYYREFSLTKDEFYLYTQKNCFYCNQFPSNIHISHHDRSEISKQHEAYKYSGLDRIDSLKGYTLDNIVSCCKICNIAKHNMTQNEFLLWIKSVVKHLKLFND